MAKPNIDALTQDETLALFKECLAVLTFDDVWTALMGEWDGDDKEEALARLNDECVDDDTDC